MSEWRTAKMAELASGTDAIAIGPFGSALKASEYTADGIPVVRGQNLNRGRYVDDSDLVYVPETVAHRLNRSMVRPGDLVFPHRGAIGAVGLVRGGDYLLSSSMMKFTGDPLQVDPAYLTYYFLGPGRRELLIRASTVGTPGIAQPLTSLRDIDVRLPPLVEQKAIADVLGALDDKIEANRKLAATADELVRSEFNAMLAHASRSVSVGDVARNVRDSVQPSGERQEYVGLEHLPRRHMWLDCVPEPTEISSAKSRFARGDVLFGKLRPNFHKVVSAPVAGICSTEILVLRASEADLAGFVLAASSSDLVLREVTRATEGTRMPRTNWKQLSAVEIPWPGAGEVRRASARILAIRDSIEAKLRENEHLSALRDTLLPKLMSGELRVEDAMEVAAL